MLKPLRRALLAFVLLLPLWLASGVVPVFAHATPVRSDPVDGTTLAKAPRQVRIWFDEGVVAEFSKIELVDNEGKSYPVLNLHREADTSGQVLLVGDLPELPANAYRANWQTRSEDDLHSIKGSFIFGIQLAITGPTGSSEAPATQPLEVILRWLTFAGLGMLVGTLALARRMNPGAVRLSRRLGRLALAGSLVTALAQAALVLYQGIPDGSLWQILSNTAYGMRWWISQAVLLVLALILLFQPKLKAARKGLWLLSSLLLVVLIVVQAMNGHSAPGRDFWYFLNLTIDSLHLLAASFWAGGLLVLAVLVIPLLRPTSGETGQAWQLLGGFGKLAGFSLLVLIVTGLYKSGQQITSLDGLLTTLYGQALMVKLELVLLVALLGLLNTAILHPGVGRRIARLFRRSPEWRIVAPRYLPRLIVVETIGLALVLLTTAFLTSSQPARGPEFEPVLAETISTISQQEGDLVFSFSVKPNRPGQNFLNISVLNTRRPAPAPITDVNVRLHSLDTESNDLQLKAESLGSGRYQVAGNYFKTPGRWEIQVTANRPSLGETSLTIPWQVLPVETTRRPVVFSNQPIAPWLNLGAILIVILAGVALALYQFRFIPRPFGASKVDELPKLRQILSTHQKEQL